MKKDNVPSVSLPNLYMPFPSIISPYADLIHKNTVRWLHDFRIFAGEAEYRKFHATKIGCLAGRFHPYAPPDVLQLVSDWYGWMFFRDDQRDESPLGRDPERLASTNAKFIDILKGTEPLKSDSPLAHALWNLRQRVLAKTPSKAWMTRFVYSIAEHFDSTVWEATNRSRGLTPDLDTYIRMRPITGGMHVDTEFIEIADHVRTHLKVYKYPNLQRLTQASNNVICWANDILSLGKEMRNNDVHNLVIVLQRTEDLKLQEAINRSVAMHDDEVRTFIELKSQCLHFSQNRIDNDLERFASILETRMRGNLDWAYESGRYTLKKSDDEPLYSARKASE